MHRDQRSTALWLAFSTNTINTQSPKHRCWATIDILYKWSSKHQMQRSSNRHMTCVLPVPQQHTGAPDSTHYLLVKLFMRRIRNSCEGQSKHQCHRGIYSGRGWGGWQGSKMQEVKHVTQQIPALCMIVLIHQGST